MTRALFTALGLLVCAAGASAEEIDRTFNQRFDVKPGARLELHHGDGEVELTPWDEDAIAVDVRYRVDFRRVGVGGEPDLTVDFDQSGDVVRVIGREKSVVSFGITTKTELEYVYRIRAPRYVELDFKGEDGDLTIGGWRARIALELDDGNVRLRDIEAPEVRIDLEDGDIDLREIVADLDLELDDGDVEISGCRGERIRIDVEDGSVDLDRCSGSFEISTDDGDLDLRRIAAGEMELSTSDGRVELELEASSVPLDAVVRTDDGDVSITTGAGVSARFELSSSDGQVKVEAESVEVGRDTRRASGTLGGGEGTIRVASDGGDVTLRQTLRQTR